MDHLRINLRVLLPTVADQNELKIRETVQDIADRIQLIFTILYCQHGLTLKTPVTQEDRSNRNIIDLEELSEKVIHVPGAA